jgi:hypothetical protein
MRAHPLSRRYSSVLPRRKDRIELDWVSGVCGKRQKEGDAPKTVACIQVTSRCIVKADLLQHWNRRNDSGGQHNAVDKMVRELGSHRLVRGVIWFLPEELRRKLPVHIVATHEHDAALLQCGDGVAVGFRPDHCTQVSPVSAECPGIFGWRPGRLASSSNATSLQSAINAAVLCMLGGDVRPRLDAQPRPGPKSLQAEQAERTQIWVAPVGISPRVAAPTISAPAIAIAVGEAPPWVKTAGSMKTAWVKAASPHTEAPAEMTAAAMAAATAAARERVGSSQRDNYRESRKERGHGLQL